VKLAAGLKRGVVGGCGPTAAKDRPQGKLNRFHDPCLIEGPWSQPRVFFCDCADPRVRRKLVEVVELRGPARRVIINRN
jgi:hypothetical protein